MSKNWSISEIAKLVQVSPTTIRNWEEDKLISPSFRVGLAKRRVWSSAKVLLILEFARDIAGYPIPDRIFEQVRGNSFGYKT